MQRKSNDNNTSPIHYYHCFFSEQKVLNIYGWMSYSHIMQWFLRNVHKSCGLMILLILEFISPECLLCKTFPDIQVQNALCGLDVWDKRTEGRWFWTDEQQSKTPHPSCNRYNNRYKHTTKHIRLKLTMINCPTLLFSLLRAWRQFLPPYKKQYEKHIRF